MMPAADITGQRFGSLVVNKRHGSIDRKVQWACTCDCGATAYAIGTALRLGRVKSCGCLKTEAVHGDARRGRKTSEYLIWVTMRQRCTNPKNKGYSDYGGRGISICDRWMNSFDNFIADMGRRPSPHHSLDRHPDNDGNYEPKNCRWATGQEQANNRRPRRTSRQIAESNSP